MTSLTLTVSSFPTAVRAGCAHTHVELSPKQHIKPNKGKKQKQKFSPCLPCSTLSSIAAILADLCKGEKWRRRRGQQ